MDLFGPSAIGSYGGNRYTLVIVDDYSRYTWTRFLKDKTEAFDQFEIFSRKIQNQLGCSIVSIRTDHGREFDNEVKRGFQPERLAQGLEVGSIWRIQGIGYGVLEFLGVGTTFDIFQNLHILYLQYGVLSFSRYAYYAVFLWVFLCKITYNGNGNGWDTFGWLWVNLEWKASDEELEELMKDQLLPVDASPIALSSGYISDSDLEEDDEEDQRRHLLTILPTEETMMIMIHLIMTTMIMMSDCPELKNQNHENRGTGARGVVHALGGGETNQDHNDMEEDINA
ncbi:retrovirus-related pol polyprotein from transposon TNT 1-94 [Tanacetum coccineum]